MSDRLAELRRQRALVQEHLAWLDREIATESKSSPSANIPALPSLPARESRSTAAAQISNPPSGAPLNIDSATPTAPTDSMLDEYRVAPETVREDVRKGCLLYFFAAFAALVLVVAVLYFALSWR